MPVESSVPTTWCHWPLLRPAADSTVRRWRVLETPGPSGRVYTPNVTRPLLVRYSSRSDVVLADVPVALLPKPRMRPPWVLVVRIQASTLSSSTVGCRSFWPAKFTNGGWTMRLLVLLGLAAVLGSPAMAPGRPKVKSLTVPFWSAAESWAVVDPGESPSRQ